MKTNVLIPLIVLTLLAGCASSSRTGGGGESNDNMASAVVLCSAACDPAKALLALRRQYPEARFYLDKLRAGPGAAYEPVEIKFDTTAQLEEAVSEHAAARPWASCLIAGRTVCIHTRTGQFSVVPGPYLWSLRGRPRESTTAFLDGVAELTRVCELRDLQLELRLAEMAPAEASALCARLGVARVDLLAHGADGKAVIQETIATNQLSDVKSGSQAQASVGSTSMHLLFLDGSVTVSLDIRDAAEFQTIAARAELDR